MSLLQKASIITTPTAYAEDYLYSIKPAYALGSELVTNGTFDTDSNWTKGTGWTISGGVASCSGGSANLTQSVSATVGTTYRVSFTITAYNSGAIRTTFNTISSQDYNSVGTFVDFFKITSITSGQILLDPRGTFDGSIDNVSVKEVTDADFDFDRNSTGTRVNEDYLIEDVPYNLLTYSEEIKSANSWTIQSGVTVTNNDVLAPNGTFTADKLVGNGTVGVFKQVTNLDGVITRSVYLKSVTGNVSVTIKDPVLTQTTKTLNLNETWQRYTLTEDNLQANNIQGIWIDDIPSSGIYMWGAQIVKGDQPKDYLKTTDRLDIPRIDYTNGEPSILLEPSRTNSFDYSQDFSDTYWDKVGVTIGSNVTTSPEGITNASKIKETSASGYHNINWDGNVTSGTTYTVSVFFKADDRTTASLYENVGSGSLQLSAFNLETGKVDTENPNHTALMLSYPNGWYRCSITFTPNASRSGSIYIAPNNTLAYTGVTDSGVFVYGAQFEVGSYATSLIHTSGSAVTRSADVANNAGNNDLFNDTESAFFVEIEGFEDGGLNRYIVITDDAASPYTNTIGVLYRNDGQLRILHNGIDFADSICIVDIDQTLNHKIAVRYKENDMAVYIDGVSQTIRTSFVYQNVSGLNQLKFSQPSTTSNAFQGKVKMLAVFKEALTDLELEKLTGYNNHELYMNYYNRLSYLGLAEEYNVESDINNYIL